MKSEVIDPVVAQLIQERCARFPLPPSTLSETYEVPAGLAGVLVGILSGAAVGAHTGIALGPLGAMAGTVPGAIIGGIVGYFGGAKAGQAVEKSPDHTHDD